MSPLILPTVLISFFTTTLTHAESLCDPGSFLSAKLRKSWCAESEPVKKAAARPSTISQRNPASQKDEEEDDEDDEDEEEVKPKPAPVHPVAIPREAAPVIPEAPAASSAALDLSRGAECMQKTLRFSADNFPSIPANSSIVWGGNATEGGHVLNPPFSQGFLSRVKQARNRGVEVFAYLEGPCGDTGGHDDGERNRCKNLHNAYNRQFAPGTPNTPLARWKPYTLKQMKLSGQYGIGHCEIDNLENNVTVPLIPLLKELKALFDKGEIYCRIVLKNVPVSDINSIIKNIAPTPPDAAFISPFAIFEANGTGQKRALDAAMKKLKGSGSTVIFSLDTNHYGSRFTPDKFLSCGK